MKNTKWVGKLKIILGKFCWFEYGGNGECSLDDVLIFIHNFSDEIIGKNEKEPNTKVTVECAEKTGSLIIGSKGRNLFRDELRAKRDKLLGKRNEKPN